MEECGHREEDAAEENEKRNDRESVEEKESSRSSRGTEFRLSIPSVLSRLSTFLLWLHSSSDFFYHYLFLLLRLSSFTYYYLGRGGRVLAAPNRRNRSRIAAM